MVYRIHTEPNYDIESIAFLEAIINGTTTESEKEEVIKRHNGSITEEDLEPFFREPAILEEYVRQNLDFDIPGFERLGSDVAEFLYKSCEQSESCPASALYLYDQYLARGIDDRMLAVIAFALPEYCLQNELETEPHNISSEADLFRLMETSGLDKAVKYDVLKLYFNFDAYYQYHRYLTEKVTVLIKDKQEIFRNKIERCMSLIDRGLQAQGAKFFLDACGVNVSDDLEYDIYPFIYRVRTTAFSGSQLISNSIHVGTGYLDISAMVRNAKSNKDLLLEFLKVLSDNTKLSIIQMLKESQCYGGQLAERLGLTGATISHHMSALIKLDLVLINKEAAKVYYSLNTEKMQRYIDDLRRLLI